MSAARITFCGYFLILTIFFIALVFDEIQIYKFILIIIYFIVFLTAYNKERNILHPNILFLICFFFFLCSRVLLDIISSKNFAQTDFFTTYIFTKEIQKKILLSLIIALLGFSTGQLYRSRANEQSTGFRKYDNKIIIKFTFIILVISFFAYLSANTIRIHQSFTKGYLSLYLSPPSIPKIIRALQDIFIPTIAFSFLLDISSKYIKAMNIMTAFACIASILTGARGNSILIILTYLFFYNYYLKHKKVPFHNIILPGLFMFIPLIVVGLTRLNTTYKIFSEVISIFFWGSGESLTVQGYLIERVSEINNKIYYLLMPALHYLLRIMGVSMPVTKAGQTYETVMNSYNLAQKLSYLVNEKLYLSGLGLGSSNIAEFYLVGGYFLIFLGYLFYSAFFSYLVNKAKRNKPASFLLFVFTPFYIYSPRWNAFGFLEIISPLRCLPFILLFYILYKYCKPKKTSPDEIRSHSYSKYNVSRRN
jgi:oligosaccharide repeat unit polymerase